MSFLDMMLFLMRLLIAPNRWNPFMFPVTMLFLMMLLNDAGLASDRSMNIPSPVVLFLASLSFTRLLLEPASSIPWALLLFSLFLDHTLIVCLKGYQ